MCSDLFPMTNATWAYRRLPTLTSPPALYNTYPVATNNPSAKMSCPNLQIKKSCVSDTPRHTGSRCVHNISRKYVRWYHKRTTSIHGHTDRLLKPLAGYTLYDHKTNDYIRRELRITGILDRIDEYRRNWLSHLQRMPQNRMPLKSYHYRPQGRRTIGRLRNDAQAAVTLETERIKGSNPWGLLLLLLLLLLLPFHLRRSWTCAAHFISFIFLRSFPTSSSHRDLDFPLV